MNLKRDVSDDTKLLKGEFVMELTKGQQKGLEKACRRYKEHKKYTVIAGYAGTGKSTLVKFIINELELSEYDVVYIAYTGRAVKVLQEKGNDNAMTAHKLLYRSKENKDGTYTHEPRRSLEHRYKMIVADEASMLTKEMIELLMHHGVYTLYLGDPAQLPPIDSEQDILDEPHVFLDEVVRQALDNPIISLSMNIRNGKFLNYSDSDKRCRIISPDQVSDKLLLGASQILCGKNITRHQLNEYMRYAIWGNQYTKNPVDGDKIICLHNEWEICGSYGSPLVNGQIGTIDNVRIKEEDPYGKVVIADFICDDGEVYKGLKMDYKLITEGQKTIDADNWKKFVKVPKLFEFAYANAITVHKSQGSEFDRVVVYDEWLGDKEYHNRWLYTAATRAAKQLVIVK